MNHWNNDIQMNRNIQKYNHNDNDIEYYGDYNYQADSFNSNLHSKVRPNEMDNDEDQDLKDNDLFYNNNNYNNFYNDLTASSSSISYHSNKQHPKLLRNNEMNDRIRSMNQNTTHKNVFPGNNAPNNRPLNMNQYSNNNMKYLHTNQTTQLRTTSSYAYQQTSGGSNAQGRAINKMLLEVLRDRVIDPQRLDLAIESYCERMDCVNLATLLFHTGKKRMLLMPSYISRIAKRFMSLKEELRSREASNALYGLKVMSSDISEVRDLVLAIANKITSSTSEFVAQAVGNALYGLQMMTSDHEEVRFLLGVLANKVSSCIEHLEAQNVGNALYGLRGMNSDYAEVRAMITSLTPKIATAREDLNGQALGNSLYGLQSMSSSEPEVRFLLTVLATKVTHTWEDLKAQEIGNALYGLKRMCTDVPEVRILITALVPKIAASPDVLDSQAIGNSFYGLQNMKSDNVEVLSLLTVLSNKVEASCLELDGQAIGNSLYGLQGMSSDHSEVRSVIKVLTNKISSSCLDMNAQELGNSLFGLQNLTCDYIDVRRLISALTQKIASSKQELSSQEIGNAMYGLKGISSSSIESRMIIRQVCIKLQQSHLILDPTAISMCLFGLQCMSSESQDIRIFLNTLGNKIEHNWKLFSAQHLTNCFFGLQFMSSHEQEVKFILKSLIPKVLSCRDVFTGKQIGYFFYGLRSMNSEHDEVISLVSALIEKVSLSTDPWTLHVLSMVLYGMQGFSSDHDAVASLLQVIARKVGNELKDEPIDANLLANCFFGLQRMSTLNQDVYKIVNVLTSKLLNILPNKIINSKLVSNLIFGLQNSNCNIEFIKKSLYLLANVIEQISNNFMNLSQNSKKLDSNNDTFYIDALNDILSLYQTVALSVFAMRDLASEIDLHTRLYTELSTLRNIIDMHGSELVLHPLNIAERRMAKQVTELFATEDLTVKSGVLVHGFAMNTYVCTYKSQLVNDALTSYDVNIEVEGSSYNFPSKELFFKLRKQYLEKEHGLKVETVPSEYFRTENQSGMKRLSQILGSFHRLNSESRDNFSIRGLNELQVADSKSFYNNTNSWDPTSNASFFSHNYSSAGLYNLSQQQQQQGDYSDDNLKTTPTTMSDNMMLNNRLNKSIFGMSLDWLGVYPMVEHPLSVLIHNDNEQQLQHSIHKHIFPGSTIGINLHSSSEAGTIIRSTPIGTNRIILNNSSGLFSSKEKNILNYPTHNNSLEDGILQYGTSVSMDSLAGGSRNSNAVLGRESRVTSVIDSIDKSFDIRKSENIDSIISEHLSNYNSSLSLSNFQENKSNNFKKQIIMKTQTAAGNSLALSPSTYFSEAEIEFFPIDDTTKATVVSSNQTVYTPGSSCSLDNSGTEFQPNEDVDDEIAALEAQLEVARLEAKLKLLKVKKKQK